MHIRRAAVPASPEPASSSLALLPLLSLSVLVFILLFFAIRVFKRSLHLPSLTWLRGKGQGAKRSLGLSSVELLPTSLKPTSLKPVPTPGPSPYAASFTLEGNSGKDGSTSLLSRSSSLDGLPQFVVSGPSPPPTSPGRSNLRSPFTFPDLFNSKRKPLHRRSRSLGGPVRDLLPSISLVTGSSAPPTPSPQALLIDFSSSNSSASTSSDLGTHKFHPGSTPLIPGLPIPTLSPARPTTSKSHTFPASSSHNWAFDQEDDIDDGADSRATDPLLTTFKRLHFTPFPKFQPEPEPLIQYDRSTSPSLFHAPPTPALAPKRVSTANPFASLVTSSSSATYIPQLPVSASQLTLSPSSPPGIELIPVRFAPAAVELVSITRSPPPQPRLLTLVDLDTDEESDVAQAQRVGGSVEGQETPAVFVPPPTHSQFDTEESENDAHVQDAPPDAMSTHIDLAADPFDDSHAITLSKIETETEDPWGTLPSTEIDREHAHAHWHQDPTPSAPPSPAQGQPLTMVSAPLTLVSTSAPPSPIADPFPVPTSAEVPISSSPTGSPEPEPLKALTASWQWDDAWSPAPMPQVQHQHTSGWPFDIAPRPLEGVDVEARGVDVTDAGGEVDDDLISFERDNVAPERRRVETLDKGTDVDVEMDPADAWFIEEPTAVWDMDMAWSGDGRREGGEEDLKRGGGSLFEMETGRLKEADEDDGYNHGQEHEREVQIRFLDGLLAGPSVPVDVHVFEESEAQTKAGKEPEPTYEDQEDEVYDRNDVHDIDDTTTTTTATHVTLDTTTTTATTTTLRSVLSTPTTPNTPLPALPPTPLLTLTTNASVEEHPDPDLLPLPSLPLSPVPISPAPLSPQPLKFHSPSQPLKPLSSAQTPTPPASPPPMHHVPSSRPLWSLRAADAPPLGLPAATSPSATPASRASLALATEPEAKPVVEVGVEVGSDAVVEGGAQVVQETVVVAETKPVEEAAVTVVVDAPEEEEYPPAEPQPALFTSLPGSFPTSPKARPAVSLPVPAPVHLTLRPRAVEEPSPSSLSSTTSSSASSTATAASTNASTKVATRAVQPSSNRLRPPRSALDLALAMQLRPGLGAGADPAWMVRFLMVMFGWVAVFISGDV